MTRLSKDAVWAIVHDERRRLADDLTGLPTEAWAAASLCPGWTVHDVLAHVVDTARGGTVAFVRDLVSAGFDFDAANRRGIDRARRTDPADTVADLRAAADLRRSPPAPVVTRLVEAVVHGEDIRRPLGLTGVYPIDAVLDCLDYQLGASVRWGGSRERAEGLRLIAADADFVHGAGTEVHAPAIDLLMRMCGRP